MDESTQNAPTVHGNTADLPAALASIIGMAGMETRIDHGEPGRLGAWLQDRCREGFDLPEAEAPLPPDLLQIRRHTQVALRARLASGGGKRLLCAPSAYSSVCPG
jgi:hypothetical protein